MCTFAASSKMCAARHFHLNAPHSSSIYTNCVSSVPALLSPFFRPGLPPSKTIGWGLVPHEHRQPTHCSQGCGEDTLPSWPAPLHGKNPSPLAEFQAKIAALGKKCPFFICLSYGNDTGGPRRASPECAGESLRLAAPRMRGNFKEKRTVEASGGFASSTSLAFFAPFLS